MKRKKWLKALESASRAHPDLRVGQLLHAAVNAANEAGGEGGRGGGVSTFYCPDAHLLKGLDLLAQTTTKGGTCEVIDKDFTYGERKEQRRKKGMFY